MSNTQTDVEPKMSTKALETEVPPTTWEAEDYPNRPGVRRYEKTVRFASIASVKAGWPVKDLGLWSLTDEGSEALEEYADPELFQREAIKRYREWKRARGSADEDDEAGEETETPSPSATLEEAEETAWTEVHTYLQNMPPFEFQDLVASLLITMDYHVAYVAPAGPDRGIDIVAFRDPLGATQPRIKVQVKGERTASMPRGFGRSWRSSVTKTSASSSRPAGSLQRPNLRLELKSAAG